LVTGLYNTVAHPIDTATGVYNFGKAAVNDPLGVGKNIAVGLGNTLSNPEGIGTAVFGVVSSLAPGAIASRGAAVSRTTIVNGIDDFLGPGSRAFRNDAGDLIMLSADEAKRIRFDINRPYPHQSPHAHVDQLIDGQWQKSGQIYPTDVPPR
jgi:hypothetical protein